MSKKTSKVIFSPKNVDQYILQFEPRVQEQLFILRNLFFELLPQTEESIRYKMPAYRVGKDYLYFAAYKKHIGLYPIYDLPDLEKDYAPFKAKKAKDTLHFMLDQPLPIKLIKKIIIFKSS